MDSARPENLGELVQAAGLKPGVCGPQERRHRGAKNERGSDRGTYRRPRLLCGSLHLHDASRESIDRKRRRGETKWTRINRRQVSNKGSTFAEERSAIQYQQAVPWTQSSRGRVRCGELWGYGRITRSNTIVHIGDSCSSAPLRTRYCSCGMSDGQTTAHLECTETISRLSVRVAKIGSSTADDLHAVKDLLNFLAVALRQSK